MIKQFSILIRVPPIFVNYITVMKKQCMDKGGLFSTAVHVGANRAIQAAMISKITMRDIQANTSIVHTKTMLLMLDGDGISEKLVHCEEIIDIHEDMIDWVNCLHDCDAMYSELTVLEYRIIDTRCR